jgi:hypothetical protein
MHACDVVDWSLLGNVMSGIGSIIAAVFTILLFSLARTELKRNNLIAEGDLYFRIKEDFDTDVSRKMHACIVDNQITFDKDGTSPTIKLRNHECYTLTHFTYTYLGSFEDLAFFHEKGLISHDVLDAGFGYMILEAGNNETICEIVRYLRNGKEKDKSVYSGFEKLYIKIRNTLNDEQKELFRVDFSSSLNPPNEN